MNCFSKLLGHHMHIKDFLLHLSIDSLPLERHWREQHIPYLAF